MPITPSNPFKGRRFPGEVIILCVRWYLQTRMLLLKPDGLAGFDDLMETVEVAPADKASMDLKIMSSR